MTVSRTLRFGSKLTFVLAGLPVACGMLLSLKDASACGGLYAPPKYEVKQVPKRHDVPRTKEQKLEPKTESNLIVFDEAREIEHLVRDIRFDRTSKNVSFMVPVPSKSSVTAVEQSPFVALSGIAPATPEAKNAQTANAVMPEATVQKVGSFVVTHLDAKDAAKVEAWMKDNGVEDSPAHREWRAHHAAAGFHYAAFHYQAQGDEWTLGMTNETVKLTFATKVPYLPYREVNDGTALLGDERQNDLWVVASNPMRPIAGHTAWSGDVTIAQPFLQRQIGVADAGALASTFGALASILPAGPLVLQAFRDKKPEHTGWGDVVLVPAKAGTHVAGVGRLFAGDPFVREATTIDQAWASERTRFATMLDPRLELVGSPRETETPTFASNEGESPTPIRVAFGSAGVVALLASIALRRRARRSGFVGNAIASTVVLGASLFLVSCAMTTGDDASPKPATAAKVSYDRKALIAYAALDGHNEDVQLDASEPFLRELYTQALRARFKDVTACYKSVAARERGTVEVRLRIDTNGNVVAAQLDGGTLENVNVAKCVTTQLSLAKFPTSSQMVNLRYAVDLGLEAVWTNEGVFTFNNEEPVYKPSTPLPLAFQSH